MSGRGGVMSLYADMTEEHMIAQRPFRLPRQPTEPDLVATYFKVLSDPGRVRVLELLRDRGELSVGQLTEALGLGRTNLSNHLACLRWCGFVQTRREHRTVYYRVADARVSELLALGRALLQDNAEHVAACRRVDEGEC
jgi:ArsR family transcriptional regulator, cadmium/lead-responsive transcriptional repressor